MRYEKRKNILNTAEIKEGCIKISAGDNKEAQVCVAQEELRQGIDIVEQYEKSVTFYGSARLKENHVDYKKAQDLAKKISELGYIVLSGGGPGIMEAANRGAKDANGKSVGLTIKLPTEQRTNGYVNEEIPFYFFFTRRVVMSYTAKACLFFPGGFGTFDEFFEMITMKQTGKIKDVPLILVGSEFWKPLDNLIKETLLNKYNTISEEDINLYTITDDETDILNIIKNSKIKDGDNSLE